LVRASYSFQGLSMSNFTSSKIGRLQIKVLRNSQSEQAGFTIVELLTVVCLIGILSVLALTGFSVYRQKAAYAVASSSYKSARNALEASTADTTNLPGAVAAVVIADPGPVTVAGARDIMIGMQIPKNLKMRVSYDPNCLDATCIEAFMSSRHCLGREYLYWFRRGDGVESLVENVAGAGCP
jgi:prepilin-type N-terminal cleavage/methylation domain-containing protein